MKGRRARRLAAPLLACAATWLTASCALREAPRAHVVCVLVDQLRKESADRWMARTNELAGRGVAFEEMRSAAPWTYPSVVSMFSGLYPQQHGADGHRSGDLLSTFSREVPLLQQRLREAGYRTAAFVANPFLHPWNPFHEGFDSYDVHFVGSQGNRRNLRELVWKPAEMFSDAVNAAIFARFDALPLGPPEFTYVHYIDVHGPWQGAPFEPSYRAAVRHVDARIAELYEYFTRRYDGRLLFFVTSDHGRALGDDERVGSGRPWRKTKASLHDFNLRIPFAVLPSKLVTGPRRVTAPCSNVDFAPTLLDWLGLPPFEGVPGRSLLPLLRGEEAAAGSRPIYARMSAFGTLADAVVHERTKYMRIWNAATGELKATPVFDLERDPREMVSLGEDLGRGEALLADAAASHGIEYPARFEGLDPELEQRLQALGYLGGEP